MGCNEAQGYGISRPIPADELLVWLNNYKPNKDWLAYGSKYHSAKETKIKLLRLTTQHWFDKFKLKQHSLLENKETWSFLSHKKCHHGAWIERAKREQFFDSDWLNELEQAHETMHFLAQKQASFNSEENIKELETAFNKMNLILGQYE